MIDNPKVFIAYIIGAILIITVGVTAYQWRGNETPDTSSETATTTTTGKKTETPTKTTTSTTQKTSSTVKPVAYDFLVTYTNSGFSPNKLDAMAGKTVRFVNRSTSSMRISPVETLENASYSGFRQSSTVGKDGTFDVVLSQKGIFLYENLNDKTKTGIVIVH